MHPVAAASLCGRAAPLVKGAPSNHLDKVREIVCHRQRHGRVFAQGVVSIQMASASNGIAKDQSTRKLILKDDNPHWTAEGLAEQTLVLLERIREAEVCMEGSEAVYLNVLGDLLETCDTLPNAKELAVMLEEVQNDEDGPANLSYLDEESPYKTDTPEESHILTSLTRHRIRGGEDVFMDEFAHYDHNSRPPRAEKIIEALGEKMRESQTLGGMVDLLVANTASFNELHKLYLEVVEKHDLDTVSSKSKWVEGKSLEEIVDATRAPIDFAASIDNWSLSNLVENIVWQLQSTAEEDVAGKFDDFLSRVPDAFFIGARELHAEITALLSQRDDFQAWIMDRASNGVFRTEIMAEIERRWAGSDNARRIGRLTIERMENNKSLNRKKVQGKLHFTHA
jgi:hypothetical protein